LEIDRDYPPAVKDRIECAQRALLDQLKEAARAPKNAAGGCVRMPPAFGSWGPPAPRFTQRMLGRHVEVVFSFARLPRSLACRPWDLAVVVYSGRKRSPTFKNWVEHFRIRERRGRVVVGLPWAARSPYHVIVEASAITNQPGPSITRALRCPRGGCPPGPTETTYPMPKPSLPVRGLDRGTLERSLDYVLADERRPPMLHAVPGSVQCVSIHSCVITYVDPAFPNAPFHVPYAVVGEQVPGCWLAAKQRVLDPLPFSDADTARFQLVGCASWHR
jgi:hypothetical protein